jgi:hypothetical protein
VDSLHLHLGLPDAQDPRAGVVCVGDKAMIQVEEPISYPLNEACISLHFFEKHVYF